MQIQIFDVSALYPMFNEVLNNCQECRGCYNSGFGRDMTHAEWKVFHYIYSPFKNSKRGWFYYG